MDDDDPSVLTLYDPFTGTMAHEVRLTGSSRERMAQLRDLARRHAEIAQRNLPVLEAFAVALQTAEHVACETITGADACHAPCRWDHGQGCVSPDDPRQEESRRELLELQARPSSERTFEERVRLGVLTNLHSVSHRLWDTLADIERQIKALPDSWRLVCEHRRELLHLKAERGSRVWERVYVHDHLFQTAMRVLTETVATLQDLLRRVTTAMKRLIDRVAPEHHVVRRCQTVLRRAEEALERHRGYIQDMHWYPLSKAPS